MRKINKGGFNRQKIPIIFIHYGMPNFLNTTIRQAFYTNTHSNIILLGDKENNVLSSKCNHIYFEHYNKNIKYLKEVYQHKSTNSYEFEFFCIKRWFVLLEYMKESKIDWLFYLDSDVLVYNSIQSFFEENICKKDIEAAFCIPMQEYEQLRWAASAHTAFISKDFLEKLCDFILNIYANNFSVLEPKIHYHKRNNIAGGICDMTLLYLYYYGNANKIMNLLIPAGGKVFDHNFNSASNYFPKEFVQAGEYKEVFFKNNKPNAFNSSGNRIVFKSLHFQGSAKKDIQKYSLFYNTEAKMHLQVSILKKWVKNKILNLFNQQFW
jgi:hypothetical protein